MPPTAAKHSYGTVLKKASITIAEVVDISGPELKKDTVEVTHLLSPNRYKEYLSSLRDGGEVTFKLNFQPNESTHKELTASYNADAPENWSIVWSDGTTWGPFSATITSLSPAAAKDKALECSATLKLVGTITLPT